jgi:hypothetical protein
MGGVWLFGQSAALSSVGALGASNLYMSYMAIGAVTDAHAYGAYEDAAAVELVKSFARFVLGSRESLNVLQASSELSEADENFVIEMIEILDLLLKESEAYLRYMDTGERSWADKFDESRAAAWEKIITLTGVSGE